MQNAAIQKPALHAGRNRKLRGDDGCIAGIESSEIRMAMIADVRTACDYCRRLLLTLSTAKIVIHTAHAGTLATALKAKIPIGPPNPPMIAARTVTMPASKKVMIAARPLPCL